MHQYLFFIGDFPIRAYGTMLALAIICSASVAYVLLKRMAHGWHEHIIDFSITVAVAGLIGARLWDVFFFDWDYYGNHLLENSLCLARRYGHSRWRGTRHNCWLLVSSVKQN